MLVGHGGYYGSKGCPDQANVSDPDAEFVLHFFQRFYTVVRTAAEAKSVIPVDLAGPAGGHDACAGADVVCEPGD